MKQERGRRGEALGTAREGKEEIVGKEGTVGNEMPTTSLCWSSNCNARLTEVIKSLLFRALLMKKLNDCFS